jgi:hypothetical protein
MSELRALRLRFCVQMVIIIIMLGGCLWSVVQGRGWETFVIAVVLIFWIRRTKPILQELLEAQKRASS